MLCLSLSLSSQTITNLLMVKKIKCFPLFTISLNVSFPSPPRLLSSCQLAAFLGFGKFGGFVERSSENTHDWEFLYLHLQILKS